MNEDCLKLTTYFGERDRAADELLSDELMGIYSAHRLQTSVLLRGICGFGRLHHLHTDLLLTLSEDLPVVSVAVDQRHRIESVLEAVLQVKRKGLITLERARLLAGEIDAVDLPDELTEAVKLTIYVGRQERVGRTPAFVAICDLLYRRGIAGASVLLGVDGTRQGRRFRAQLIGRNADVPMMIIAVGDGAKIATVLPELGSLLREPLLTLERVRVCKRDGELLAKPHELPGTDEHGMALWQKLMVYTSHATMYDGRPLHQEIIQRLRKSDAAGVTAIAGIWGFHGDHPPRGDKFFQRRRHVPVCTIAIDTPEQTASSFAIIDELTSEHGLVTSEMVPAMTALSSDRTRGGLELARHRF